MKSKVTVRVLVGFVDVRANFRSYVPGDVVDLARDKAESLVRSGNVEVVQPENPASRRQTKVTTPAETK